jgi:hypothetical protein
VRKGVIAWAERVAEQKEAPPTFDLAATLIGSGGKGMEVAQVAMLLAEAVSDADALLQSVELPRVGEFKIIELLLDRATDAWHALADQAKHAPHRYQVAAAITPGSAALRRVPGTHYRGADYDFVSVVSRVSEQGSELAYTVDGRRARTDVAHLVPQMPLLLQLLDASNAHRRHRISGGRCSTCSFRSSWRHSSATRRTWCWSWTTARPVSHGRCSTQ